MPNPRAESFWITVMRFTPAAVATALLLATMSSTSLSAPAREVPISATSRAMEAEARRLQGAGELDAAIGFFETALAADPRNADAYVGLGDIARAQQLPGKAIAYFREALALAPGNRAALAGQGEAMVQRGALDRARQTLALLEQQCAPDGCDEARRLSAALGAAGARTALRTEDVMPRPVIEAEPAATN